MPKFSTYGAMNQLEVGRRTHIKENLKSVMSNENSIGKLLHPSGSSKLESVRLPESTIPDWLMRPLPEKSTGTEIQLETERAQVNKLYLSLSALPLAEELQREAVSSGKAPTIQDNVKKTAQDLQQIICDLEKLGENLEKQPVIIVSALSKFPKQYYNFVNQRLQSYCEQDQLKLIKELLNLLASGRMSINKEFLSAKMEESFKGKSSRITTYKYIRYYGSFGGLSNWVIPEMEPSLLENGTQTESARNPRGKQEMKQKRKTQIKSQNNPVKKEVVKQISFVEKPCAFCCGLHFNSHCWIFKTRIQRLEALKSQDNCVRCFKKGHSVRNCPKKPRICFNCEQVGHHRLLCKKDDTRTSNYGWSFVPAWQF